MKGPASQYTQIQPAHVAGVNGGAPVQTVDWASFQREWWKVQGQIADLQNPQVTAPNPATVSTNLASQILTAAQNGGIFTNQSASGGITFTLPTAAFGLSFSFYVLAAHSLTVMASGGAFIRSGASLSAANGTAAAATVGNAITVACVGNNLWVAHPTTGTWTIT